jgi:TIR domain
MHHISKGGRQPAAKEGCMGPQPLSQTEPRILRVFISYASEDLNIAHAIATALSDALPEGFAEVCFDKWFLQAGEKFKAEIASKLEKTDVLIIVYTGLNKPSHSYTGWEVGFFEGVRRNDPARRIVPLFLEEPPSTVADFQGCSLKIPADMLQLTVEEFTCRNVITEDDPICKLVQELQDEVARIKEEAHYPRTPAREKHDPVSCVTKMRLAIFSYLKTTVEAVLKPQKQITIKSTGAALEASETDLPGDAKLVPMGGSPMTIFGLGDEEITWERFLHLTDGQYRDSWREAITSVILSSQAERINVDNSQVIVSSNGSTTYRIVLTTATKYWDDRREFNLYFVESLRREDYGDKDTTMILKGLELACRYRFLFLEGRSQFSANNINATRYERLPDLAARLLKEMNLQKKEAADAGIDQAYVWSQFVDWSLLQQMIDAYRPREQSVRELIGKVLNAKDQMNTLAMLRGELSKVVGELEDATREPNASLIAAMSKKLLALVQPVAA